MSSKNYVRKDATVDGQEFEQVEGQTPEDSLDGQDEQPELRANVEQETQAKVDTNHPGGAVDTPESDGRVHGVTLEQEERIKAREAELELISAQAELPQEGRAHRTREVVQERLDELEDESPEEESVDPRENLTREELAVVNRQAMRICDEFEGGWSEVVVGRRIARRVNAGLDVMDAVLETLEELKESSGVVLPIEDVPEVETDEVSVEGEVTELWTPSDSSISQVGLIEDETGKVKFTIWEASDKTVVREGERVRFRYVKKNWYDGRCSIAVTGDSRVEFPERGRWW
ncbi:MAG: DNA-binding protein, partial [Halobacteria archaeon]|nr:DNA-binding protein [Halobacteria archaeon]